MKLPFLILLGACAVLSFSACTTLENRRDMYFGYGKVNGPYTRMLKDGIPSPETPDLSGIQVTTSDFKSVR